MSYYLFTYGTLRHGHAPDEIASAVEKLQPVGEGYVHGVLHDLEIIQEQCSVHLRNIGFTALCLNCQKMKVSCANSMSMKNSILTLQTLVSLSAHCIQSFSRRIALCNVGFMYTTESWDPLASWRAEVSEEKACKGS